MPTLKKVLQLQGRHLLLLRFHWSGLNFRLPVRISVRSRPESPKSVTSGSLGLVTFAPAPAHSPRLSQTLLPPETLLKWPVVSQLSFRFFAPQLLP